MMKRLGYFALGSLAGAILTGAVLNGAQARVEDAMKVSPQFYTVRLDNSRVRVLDYHLKPGDFEPMHSHRASVAYVISGARVRTASLDGVSAEGMLNSGDVHWREKNVTHSVKNIGDTEMRALIVELK